MPRSPNVEFFALCAKQKTLRWNAHTGIVQSGEWDYGEMGLGISVRQIFETTCNHT